MDGTIFKFNVTLDKRIPEEMMIAKILEVIPGKRRGHLVRSLLADGIAYREAGNKGGALLPAQPVQQAQVEDASVPPPLKNNLFQDQD